jgi:hypothetical protein
VRISGYYFQYSVPMNLIDERPLIVFNARGKYTKTSSEMLINGRFRLIFNKRYS